MATCDMTVKVFEGNAAKEGVLVRATYPNNAVIKEGETPNGGEILTSKVLEETTDGDGEAVFTLHRDVAREEVGGSVPKVTLEIPAHGLSGDLTVPDTATADAADNMEIA